MSDSLPRGIGGWLLVYVLSIGLAGTIFLLATAQILWTALPGPDRLFLLAQLFSNVVGIVLIFALKRPATRWYHVAFNGVMAAYLFAGPLDPETIGLAFALLCWGAYWIRSERIQNTFGGRKVA
jgi:hypothetical protein